MTTSGTVATSPTCAKPLIGSYGAGDSMLGDSEIGVVFDISSV